MENIVGLCDMKLEMYGLENHLGKTMPCSIFYHSINAYFFFLTSPMESFIENDPDSTGVTFRYL
jgi:hypothetical protein